MVLLATDTARHLNRLTDVLTFSMTNNSVFDYIHLVSTYAVWAFLLSSTLQHPHWICGICNGLKHHEITDGIGWTTIPHGSRNTPIAMSETYSWCLNRQCLKHPDAECFRHAVMAQCERKAYVFTSWSYLCSNHLVEFSANNGWQRCAYHKNQWKIGDGFLDDKEHKKNVDDFPQNKLDLNRRTFQFQEKTNSGC